MNKAPAAVASVMIVIIVLAAIALVYASWQAPEPDRIVASATIALAAATLILAIVAFYQIQEARREHRETQRISLIQIEESRRQHQETQRASFLPLVIPMGNVDQYKDALLDQTTLWNLSETRALTIFVKNVGSGVASNIVGAILPSDDPNPLDTSRIFSLYFPHPIAKNDAYPVKAVFQRGNMFILPTNRLSNRITQVPLYAPANDFSPLRLSLTYSDLLGLKHASVFDFTRDGVWEQKHILNEISQDLAEMSEEFFKEYIQ